MMIKAVIGSLGVLVVAAGGMHLRLTNSSPKADATVAQAPAEIRVWFNQQPRLPVSRLELSGAGADVPLDSIRAAEGMSFKAAVRGAVPPGEYTVAWRTAGDDGHVLRGTYTFTVAPSGH